MIDFEQHVSERLYPLGFKFILIRGKQSERKCTIVDYHITHNKDGKIVKFEYVIQYPYSLNNGIMTETVLQTTIDKATDNGWKKLQKSKLDTSF